MADTNRIELAKAKIEQYHRMSDRLSRPPTVRELGDELGCIEINARQFAKYHDLQLSRLQTRERRTKESYERRYRLRVEAYDTLCKEVGRHPTLEELAATWEITPGATRVYIHHSKKQWDTTFGIIKKQALREETACAKILEVAKVGPTSYSELAELCGASTAYVRRLVSELRASGAAIEISRYWMRGETSPHWRGGVAQYQNHSELKRQRIKVLQRSKGKCEICGESANHVHHIDEDKTNHKLDNLLAVCRKCHAALHTGRVNRRRVSKYNRFLGHTVREAAEILGLSAAGVYYQLREHGPEIVKEMINETLASAETTKDGTI